MDPILPSRHNETRAHIRIVMHGRVGQPGPRYITGRPSDGLVNRICNGRSRFDSNDRIMPHKSLNLRSFVPKLQ